MNMERGNRKVQYLIMFAVSLSSITAGVSLAWAALAIPMFHSNATNIHISDSEISWMAALTAPGFITGSLSTRFTSEGLGRRATILLSALPMAIGTVFIVTSVHAWMLYTARFLWGFSSGMLATVSSVYLAELADKDIRGSLTAASRIMVYFGSFLMLCIGPCVSYQTLNYMILTLPVIYFVVCLWIPETPYYYLKEGRVDCARKELLKLSGCKDETVLDEKLWLMRTHVRKEMERASSLKELLTGKQYRRALIIVIGLKLTQMMTGSNSVMQYLGLIFQESESKMKMSTAFSIYGAMRFAVGVISSMLVDRLGRRLLLIISYFGAGIALAVVGAYFFMLEVIDQENELSVYSFIPLVGIIFYTMLSSLGFDSVGAVVAAEIFPINIKSIALTVLNIIGGISSFATVKSFQHLKDLAGLCGVFWFHAGVAFIGAVFTYFIVPETKGKSLREIQMQLHGNIYEEAAENLNQDVTTNDIADNGNEIKEQDIERKQS